MTQNVPLWQQQCEQSAAGHSARFRVWNRAQVPVDRAKPWLLSAPGRSAWTRHHHKVAEDAADLGLGWRWSLGIPRCRSLGITWCRSLGIPRCWSLGIPWRRSRWACRRRSLGVPRRRSLRIPRRPWPFTFTTTAIGRGKGGRFRTAAATAALQTTRLVQHG